MNVSLAESEVDCACAVEQVPDDVTAECKTYTWYKTYTIAP